MIRDEVTRQIFRNMMHDFFTQLESTRKRVIVKRQLMLLEELLDADGDNVEFVELLRSLKDQYAKRKLPQHAVARDISKLEALGAISIQPPL